MRYFENFKRTSYAFGDEFEKEGGTQLQLNFVQDLSQYADVVDQVREAVHFYEPYTIIENERPDQVSQKFYNSPIYHWTFFMMNDHLRQQGWPLTHKQLDEVVKRDFPNQYIYTQTDLSSVFLVGDYVFGSVSGAEGRILRRYLDLGLIIVETTDQFVAGEAVNVRSTVPNTATIVINSTGYEYNAPHHYENAAGEYVDVDPTIAVPAIYNEVTNYDRYIRSNDKLKDIKVIKPQNIVEVASAFKRALTS